MKVRGGPSILRDLGSIGLPERGRTQRVEHRVLSEPSNRFEGSRLLCRESIGVLQDPCRNSEPDFAGSPIFIEVRRSCIHAIRLWKLRLFGHLFINGNEWLSELDG